MRYEGTIETGWFRIYGLSITGSTEARQIGCYIVWVGTWMLCPWSSIHRCVVDDFGNLVPVGL